MYTYFICFLLPKWDYTFVILFFFPIIYHRNFSIYRQLVIYLQCIPCGQAMTYCQHSLFYGELDCHQFWVSIKKCFNGHVFHTSFKRVANISIEVKLLSRVWLLAIPRTAAHQAPPSMGFSRQEYWSGLPFPSPGDLPDPRIKPRPPGLTLWATREALISIEEIPKYGNFWYKVLPL